MISYSYSNINIRSIHTSKKFEVMVSISGEENAIRDFVHWFSTQVDKNPQINILFEILKGSDIQVDYYCTEIYYYYLCLYLMSIGRGRKDVSISSIIDFVNYFLKNNKGESMAFSLENMDLSTYRMLNERMIHAFSSNKTPSFIPILNTLKDLSMDSDTLLERTKTYNYEFYIINYFNKVLLDDMKNRQISEGKLSDSLYHQIRRHFNDYNKSVVLSVLEEDDEIIAVLDSLSNTVYNVMRRIYDRGESDISLPSEIREYLSSNAVRHTWMASSWTLSYLLGISV